MTEFDAPLVEAVRQAKSEHRHPLQIPGHKYRYAQDPTAVGYELLHELVRDDMPWQGGADDLAGTHRLVDRAQDLYANAIGGDHTRFLVGGSSQGNLAALLAVSVHGRPVAVDRTSHRSALSGLVLSGAMPEWIFPEIHPELGLPIGVQSDAVRAVNPTVSAVFVTSPSYVGSISDVAALSDAAHSLNLPLAVDQAWGAHLDFMPGRGAFALGADVVVTSIHKALMGYSGTAIVSCRTERVDSHRLDRAVDLTMTTSPSATLLASIDATRQVMVTDGRAALERAIAATADTRAILRRVPGLVVIDEQSLGVPVDPLKLTLWLPRTGTTGKALNDALWDEGTSVEASDRDTIVMTMSPIDEADWIIAQGHRLAAMVESLRSDAREPAPAATWQVRPDVVMSPREAVFAPRVRMSLDEAVGRVSAEQFCPYPPGVPLLGPGERVTADLVASIRLAGTLGSVRYCSDRTLATIEVVDE